MAVTDEQYDVLRGRVHEVETRSRGQMDLTAYRLGRLGSIDESRSRTPSCWSNPGSGWTGWRS
jgi:hypothetical protein